MKKQSKKDKNNAKDEVIECIYTDKKGIKITLDMLEKLLEKANSLKKSPRLVLGIMRNNKEVFLLKCSVEIERK